MHALELRAQGLSFSEMATELGGMSVSGARKALMRGLETQAAEMAEKAGEVRALESARLDAAAAAIWAKVAAGQERAQEVWLRNRTRFATLNGLDMRPEQHEEPTAVVINTALPPEVLRRQTIDEERPGELEAGEAG